MPRKSLRPQLNQIRAWVRQGRTDAWIAHQLDIPAAQLREFRRRHNLDADAEDTSVELDLRDEIEAEIEAELEAEPEPAPEPEEEPAQEGGDDEDEERPRRRRRRGGRGRHSGAGLQGVFDHGSEGYGLWIDAAIKNDPVYTEHWAGKRRLSVTVEPNRIVLERDGEAAPADQG